MSSDGQANTVPGSPEGWAERLYCELDEFRIIDNDFDWNGEYVAKAKAIIASVIREAVLAERERCANEAEVQVDDWQKELDSGLDGARLGIAMAGHDTASEILESIREGI